MSAVFVHEEHDLTPQVSILGGLFRYTHDPAMLPSVMMRRGELATSCFYRPESAFPGALAA